jgi:hypothetical protein
MLGYIVHLKIGFSVTFFVSTVRWGDEEPAGCPNSALDEELIKCLFFGLLFEVLCCSIA